MKLSDEELERLGEAYTRHHLGAILKVPFYQYALSPSYYNDLYRQWQRGQGINITYGQPRLVGAH